MRRFFCTLPRIFHSFSAWERVQELPIWRHKTYDSKAVGYQPLERQLYRSGGEVVARDEPDNAFRLSGKVIEQRRKCSICNYTEINKQTWSI